MQHKPSPAPPPREISPARLEAFSDGVLAVIITIMVLELRPPDGADLKALWGRIPGLLIYVLSFVFIGNYWNNHHHLLRATRRISGGVMLANLHLLFWLSLVPVVTAWVARAPAEPVACRHLRRHRLAGRGSLLSADARHRPREPRHRHQGAV